MNPTIVILHHPVNENSSPDDQDVLDQAQAVDKELKKMGYETQIMPFNLGDKSIASKLKEIGPVCVFNLVECIYGDGQLMHLACSYLDHLKIPYTGAGAEAMFITSNKVLAKRWMRLMDIPTPEWVVPGKPLECELPFPGQYILKAQWEDASIGLDSESVVAVRDMSQLIDLLSQKASKLGKPCFAERYIYGREFNLALLADADGAQALPPAEITFDYAKHMPKIVDYKAKWIEGSPEYEGTLRVLNFPPDDAPLLEELSCIAQKCWEGFDLKGYARVDARVDSDGRPWVLEINANPCISPNGGFMAASEKAGVPYHDMIKRIVEDAIRK